MKVEYVKNATFITSINLCPTHGTTVLRLFTLHAQCVTVSNEVTPRLLFGL